MTWASETISSNNEIRAIAIATMNTCSSLMWIWAPLVLWPVTDAPYYRKCCINTICPCICILKCNSLDRGFTVSMYLVGLFIAVMGFVAYMLKQDGLVKRANSNDFTTNQPEDMVIPLLQQQEEDEENDQEHSSHHHHHVKLNMAESPPMSTLPSATSNTTLALIHDSPISYITSKSA